MATLILAGLRVSEACNLRWADVDLTHGVLHVRQSKTTAGIRDVHITDHLRAELVRHRAERPGMPAAYVFTTRIGSQQTRQNVRRRVLAPAVKAANAYLARFDRPPINPRLTPHSLRHTFASVLFEEGATVPYVMAQLGHTDPKVTLGIYAHVLNRSPQPRGEGVSTRPSTVRVTADGQTTLSHSRALLPQGVRESG